MLCVIKIVSKLRYKLKKCAPTYEERAVNLLKYGLNITGNIVNFNGKEKAKNILVDFLRKSREKKEMKTWFFEYRERIVSIKERIRDKLRMKKTRLKLLSELWNRKQFEMIDKYSKKKSFKKLKYNKLKGISSNIKEVMLERYYDQWKLTYWLKFFEWRKTFIRLYLPNISEDNLYEQLSIDTRKDQVAKGHKAFLEAELSDNEEVKDSPPDPLQRFNEGPVIRLKSGSAKKKKTKMRK